MTLARPQKWHRAGGKLLPYQLALLLLALVGPAAGPVSVPPARGAALQVAPEAEASHPAKTTYRVVMRDGTRLATDVYLPSEGKGPWPAIFVRTPYNKNAGGESMAAAVGKKGYALVCQDIRGRFESEGTGTLLFVSDGWGRNQDGHDSLAWIARQPWCDGKIGTWGGSALGITQNLMAPGAPDSLKAQYVQVACSDFYRQTVFQGGAFRKELAEDWLSAIKADPVNLKAFIAHYKYDELWEQLRPEGQASRVNAPAIFSGGWYDIFGQGTINSFVGIQNHGRPGARGKCRLIMGPWAHGSLAELKYPANSADPGEAADGLRFFDHWLKGSDNGVVRDKPVHYYVMGDPTDPAAPGNFWRAADDWPPPAQPTRFYFHPDGRLAAGDRPVGTGKRSYRYDPRNPVPTIGGQNLTQAKGPMDQRKVEGRDDVLLFTSEALTAPVEVTGRISARLFVSSDCPDTDFTVKLTDVYPDGRSMLVTDGILRARFRKSFRREDFLKPGEVYELAVDLWSTSLIFAKGHRIRVAVSSSNSPRFEPNPNTGKPLRADNETRIATNTLYLSERYPSHIVLPIYAGPDRLAGAYSRGSGALF